MDEELHGKVLERERRREKLIRFLGHKEVGENEEITGNLTILTLIEFPPIAAYGKIP
ncbi:MAG: hypothetical protein QW532_06965 [Archaeoglobaceae archaeon]